MKNLTKIALACSAMVATGAHADIDFYGKGNVTFEAVSEGDADTTELRSNSSRVGVKGSEEVAEGLAAIYQLEYQAFIDNDSTFTQRNIFIGLQGDFGTVMAGHFDTALKQSQNKVDVFNDLRGDINNVVTYNDNRASNSVMYVSPKLADAIEIYIDYISSEDEDVDAGVSLAITYTLGQLYLALAADDGVEEEDASAVRFVAQYSFDQFQLGFLAEESELADGESETGFLGSILFGLNDKVDLRAQVGVSDIVEQGGETVSIGADYKWSKNVKNFVFLTSETADDDVLDNNYIALGMEVKF